MNSGVSDGQSSSLRARNIEKEVEIAILAAASNTAQIVERAINGNSSEWLCGRLEVRKPVRKSHRL